MASSTTRTHTWQVESAGRWSVVGNASLQDALEASFLAKSEGHRFTESCWTYEVDFERMTCSMVFCNVCKARQCTAGASAKQDRDVRRVPALKIVPATAVVAPPPKAPAAPRPPKKSQVTTAVATRMASGGSLSTLAASVPPPKAPAPAPTLKASRGGIIQTGKVKNILKEKGFGFITVKDQEVFFHVSIPGGTSIQSNDIVEVEVSTDGSGRQRARQVLFLRKGSIFKTMCKNKFCVANGDCHFADLCPLATSVPAPAAAAAPKPAVPVAAKKAAAAAAAAPAPTNVSAPKAVPVQNRFMTLADDSEDEDKQDLCPPATSAPAAAVAPKPAVPVAAKKTAAPAPRAKSVSVAKAVPGQNRFMMLANDSDDEDKQDGDSQDGAISVSTACS